jgi:Dihydrodipicolinate synthase/N-acetylneuraminate lyase
VITPYYARPTQEGLFQWYATVASENPDLPIVVYNVPSRTAVDIAPETIARLRRRYGNVDRGQGDHPGLRALLPRAAPVRPGHPDVVGHRAAVPAAARPRRGGLRERGSQPGARGRGADVDLWTAGEQEKARELHFALHPLVDVIFTETNPAPAKWVLQQAGLLGSAHVRPPLAGVSDAGQRRISRAATGRGSRAEPAAE